MSTNFECVKCDDGRIFSVGDTIVVKNSEYEGLFGKIINIVESANDPLKCDIHCKLMPPILKRNQKELEERVSAVHLVEKKLEDISLDDVVVSPDKICLVEHTQTIGIYVLKESIERPESEYCKYTTSAEYFSTLDEARWRMRNTMETDRETLLSTWMQEEGFYEEELVENHYMAGVKGKNKRYTLYITPASITVDKSFADRLSSKFQ